MHRHARRLAALLIAADLFTNRESKVAANQIANSAVLALLGLTATQVATGLFSNDDISYQGPLAQLVSSDASERLTGLHTRLAWGLLGIIGLHLLAIAFYRWHRRMDLIRPMLTGRKLLALDDPAVQQPEQGSVAVYALKLAVALLAGALLVLGASGTLPNTNAPAAPAPQQTPSPRPAW